MSAKIDEKAHGSVLYRNKCVNLRWHTMLFQMEGKKSAKHSKSCQKNCMYEICYA